MHAPKLLFTAYREFKKFDRLQHQIAARMHDSVDQFCGEGLTAGEGLADAAGDGVATV